MPRTNRPTEGTGLFPELRRDPEPPPRVDPKATWHAAAVHELGYQIATPEHAAARDRLLDEAIAAGKFPEKRRAHYTRMYDRDPVGTRLLISKLAAVPELAPRRDRGGTGLIPELDRERR